jgi:hypothetical protein
MKHRYEQTAGTVETCMDRRYYACQVLLNAVDTFVIWYSDGSDGFVVTPEGYLIAANSSENLVMIAANLGLELEHQKVTVYDFDSLLAWCQAPTAEGVQATMFLNAWNFFDDVTRLHADLDSRYVFLSRQASHIYEKLFYGNNLPSITPIGEHYSPSWSNDELTEMRLVFMTGLDHLKKKLKP